MARKKEISREKILNTAYKMVSKYGIESLTARNIAKMGHFSTQPIYLEFNNMEELRKEVFKKLANDLMTNDLQKTYIGKPLIDLDLAYIMFAKEHVNLFKIMFVDSKLGSKIIAESFIKLGIERFKKQFPDTKYDDEQITQIVISNLVTATGIASLLINKIASFTPKQIINVLNSQVTDTITNAWLSEDDTLAKTGIFSQVGKE